MTGKVTKSNTLRIAILAAVVVHQTRATVLLRLPGLEEGRRVMGIRIGLHASMLRLEGQEGVALARKATKMKEGGGEAGFCRQKNARGGEWVGTCRQEE